MTAAQASRPFRTVALVGRYQTAGVAGTLAEIALFLQARGLAVVLESGTAQAIGRTDLPDAPAAELGAGVDLAVVVGGDGTMLGVARELAAFDVPLVGINHGRLGFMTDVPLARWREALGQILDGRHQSVRRLMLAACVTRGGETIFSATALNDVVVARGARGRMVEVVVHVDGLYMYTQRADGLVVATPTGSTAYALSANGPILHPEVRGLVLCPVAAQSLSNRPIVLPEASEVSIRVSDARDALVNCDMQSYAALAVGDTIEVKRGASEIEFLHPPGWSYFATLRQKLNWHALPADRDAAADRDFADRDGAPDVYA
jgi:NAD+ kinase